jgi:hypothetical protein
MEFSKTRRNTDAKKASGRQELTPDNIERKKLLSNGRTETSCTFGLIRN